MNSTQRHDSCFRVFNIWFTLLLSLSIISLFFLYFIWTHPLADDLYYAAVVRDYGLFELLSHDYLNWSPRWLAGGLAYLIPYLADIVEVYHFVLFCWALIHAISFCLFAALLFDTPFVSRLSLFVGISLYGLFLANLPSLREGLYWLTGATENMLVLAVAVVFFYFLSNGKRLFFGRGKFVWVPVLCLWVVVLPGFNEMFGLVFCFVLAVNSWVVVTLKRPDKGISLAVTLCALIGLVFVVAAPGNYARLKLETHGRVIGMNLIENAVSMFWPAMHAMIVRLKGWVLSPSLLIASLIVVLCPDTADAQPRWYENQRALWRVIFPLTVLIGLFLCFWTMMSTIGGLPERTEDGIYTLFFLGWFSTLFVYTREMRVIHIFKKNLFISFLIGFLFLSLYYQPNIRWAIEDLTKVPAFNQEMLLRDETIRAAVRRGVMEIEVPELVNWPKIFPRHQDLQENPDDYRSFDFAIYFKAHKVKRKSDRPDISKIAREPEGELSQDSGSSE